MTPDRRPIISPNIRVRHPEFFEIGEFSVVDDFSYFSTKVRVGVCSHIASGCTVAGGVERSFELGDFSSVSSGVRIWCASDDFARDIVALVPGGLADPRSHLIVGDVRFSRFTAVGANSVVMPANEIPEGTVIGALSLVPTGFRFEAWSVYAGVPIRLVGPRDKEGVLRQVRKLEELLGSA